RRGYRFIAPVSGGLQRGEAPDQIVASPSMQADRRRTAVLVSAVAIAAVVAGGLGFRWWMAGARPPVIRLAVVPFDNETGGGAYDEAPRGVADATVARLAAPELIDRLSVVGNAAILRKPRDRRDLQSIGKELGVEYVVLGQVKRDRERVRLIAHLIRVRD